MDSENQPTLNHESYLINLPPEVLYIIFNYLPSTTLNFQLRRVCKHFYSLLSHDGFYMVRFRKKHFRPGIEFPVLKYYKVGGDINPESPDCLSWRELDHRMDLRQTLWGNEKPCERKVFGSPHTATIHTVKIFDEGRLFVSGGRDRLLCLWNLHEIQASDPVCPISVQDDAHEGWIWSMTDYDSNSFFTCAWDNRIKFWSLNQFKEITSFRVERPAMCLASKSGTVVGGLLTGQTVMIDPRINKPSFLLSARRIHRGAITGIALWENHVVTIGEDRRMSVFDFRNQKSILCRHVNCVHDTCPRKIAVHQDICYIGDSQGYLNIFKMGGDYAPIVCANVGVARGINAIIPSIEGIVIGTSDVKIMFITPSIPFNVVREIDCHGEVPSIDMHQNTLIAGCANTTELLQYFKGIYE